MRRGALSLLGKAMISIDRVGKWRCLGTARASSSGRKSSSQVPSLVRYIPKECRKPGEESLQSVQFPGRICSSSSIDDDDEELGFEDGSFGRMTKKRTSRFYYDDTEKQRSQLGLASFRKAFGSKEGGSNFSARLDEEQDEEEDEEEEEDRNGMKLEEDSSEEEDESLEADARRSGRTDNSAVTCDGSSSETRFRSQEELSSSDEEEADEMVESAASRTTLEQDVFSRLQLVPASKLVSKPKPERKRGRFPAAGSVSTGTFLDSDDDADDASSKLASLGLVSLRDASSLEDDVDELEDEDVVDAAFAVEVERKKKAEIEIFPDSSGERSAARNYAIFLLGKWQRTAMELRKKLAEKNYSPQVIETTISALLEEGLQSDASYADVFAQSRWNTRGWGPKRIRYELVRKGVAAANIDRALQRAFQADKDGNITQESEEMRWGMSKQAEEHILALAARKWSTGGNVSVETRSRRLAGWLQRRGFGWKVVNGIVKTLERNNSQPKL